LKRKNRQQHADEDEADETSDKEQKQWFSQGDRGLEAPV
jgi:hypothetical protein